MKRLSEGRAWGELQPFLPSGGRLKILIVAASAFAGGLAESLVLVILTLSAEALIRDRVVLTFLGAHVPLRIAIGIALAAVCARVALTLTGSWISARLGSEVMLRAQDELISAYIASSHDIRTTRPTGDLSTLIVSHSQLTGQLCLSVGTLTASGFGLFAFVGSSLVVNPVATGAIALLGAVILVAIRPLRHRSRAAAREYAESARVLGQEAAGIEALHREIEVFRVGGAARRRMWREASANAERYSRLSFYTSAIPQLFQAIMLAAAVASLFFMIGNVAGASLGAVGAVILLLIRSMSSAQMAVAAHQNILERSSYAHSVSSLVATLQLGARRRGEVKPAHLLPVELRDVDFSYDGVVPVLEKVNMTLAEGELVGLVGPSGAGKSTLVELLLGLRTPTGGTLSCGGVAIDDIDPDEFARRVAFVPQDAVLISGTVAENVDLFRGLPESRIRRALKDASLEAELEALPHGIDTRLGPMDRALSGGQRQRLTIARALAGDPEIVILDEPTSALDARSEAAIRRTLAQLPVGRLVLVIAHRYSTLRSCTRIIALEGGRIESDADPDTVARRSGFFGLMTASESRSATE